MKIKDLKVLLADKPDHLTEDEFDDLVILMPANKEFDGFFISPCIVESGFAEAGMNEDGSDSSPSFMLVPCGFFTEKHEPEVDPQLN